MVRALFTVACALVAFVPLSGCFDGSAKAFDVIAAPVWSAGHTWTYEVTSSSSGSYGEDDYVEEIDEESSDRVVLSVFNTTEPLDGEAVYYAQVESEDSYVDHPFFSSQIVAYSQSTLAVTGTGYDYHTIYAEPEIAYSRVGGPYPDSTYDDPCANRGRINADDEHDSLPVGQFPLSKGTVRGQWSPSGEDDFAFDYVLRVEGMEAIETKAGRFEAVPIIVDMTPTILGGANQDFTAFRIHGEYWYAPAVEQYVRMDLTATASGGFAGERGSFHYTSNAELLDYDLAQSLGRPAPFAVSNAPVPYVPMQIVTDQTFPQNAAEGPIKAKFALAAGQSSGYMYMDDNELPIVAFPPTVPYDAANYTVSWRIHSSDYSDGEYATGEGDVFEYEFPTAGRFSIQAYLNPRVCGAGHQSTYYGTITNYWEKEWTVNVEPGLAHTIPVDHFPVSAFPAQTLLEWTVGERELDRGNVIFTNPFGESMTATEGDGNAFFVSGDWKLDWDAYGAPSPTTGTPVIGDDVTIRLRLDYDYELPYAMH